MADPVETHVVVPLKAVDDVCVKQKGCSAVVLGSEDDCLARLRSVSGIGQVLAEDARRESRRREITLALKHKFAERMQFWTVKVRYNE